MFTRSSALFLLPHDKIKGDSDFNDDEELYLEKENLDNTDQNVLTHILYFPSHERHFQTI